MDEGKCWSCSRAWLSFALRGSTVLGQSCSSNIIFGIVKCSSGEVAPLLCSVVVKAMSSGTASGMQNTNNHIYVTGNLLCSFGNCKQHRLPSKSVAALQTPTARAEAERGNEAPMTDSVPCFFYLLSITKNGSEHEISTQQVACSCSSGNRRILVVRDRRSLASLTAPNPPIPPAVDGGVSDTTMRGRETRGGGCLGNAGRL